MGYLCEYIYYLTISVHGLAPVQSRSHIPLMVIGINEYLIASIIFKFYL